MFNIFKKVSPLQKLYKKQELLWESPPVIKINRSLSDQKDSAEDYLMKFGVEKMTIPIFLPMKKTE